ncbi:MAG: glycosyltransferase family 39 protein, partial [Deltaproteobacteria bacterium]|nr:glycosyltransferase family 39 protein [Deltaproteobacteria bacterium]
MERPTDRRLAAAWHLTWLVPAAFLIWHAMRYAFVTDDAFISFVYARNLAEHGELVFNLGADPVEGYSNFLWTILLALLIKLGIGPEVSSQVMGVGFGIGTLYLAARIVRDLGDDRPSPWDAMAPSLLALTAGFACWSSGGLETQMFTFWVTLAIRYFLLADRKPRTMRWVGLFIGLASLTRPEGMLVGIVVGLHRVALSAARERRWLPRPDDLVGAAIAIGLVGAHLAFRWLYYGHPLPNTYYIKAAGDTTAAYDKALWSGGWHYLGQWARQSGALVAAPIAFCGALVARLRSPRFYFGSLAVALTVVYAVYVASVGGDFMGLHRFVMPLFVLVAL